MNDLIELSPFQLHAVIAPRAIRRRMMSAFAVRLALSGALRVLDGGNSFAAYPLARELRRYTQDWQAALERVYVRRAFTCYQMVTLLSETGAAATSTLVLDLLDTFYDENVPLPERRRLLQICLGCLQELARQGTVVVSAAPPALISGPPLSYDPSGERGRKAGQGAGVEELVSLLCAAAGQVWRFEEPLPVEQPRLPI